MSFGQSPSFLDPTKYTGDQISDVPCVNFPRAPRVTDLNYPLFTLWRNSNKAAVLPDGEGDMWYLARFQANGSNPPLAVWIKLSAGSIGDIESLSDTANTKVYPDVTGNIQLEGAAGQINIVSNPGTNSLLFSLAGGGGAIESITIDTFSPPGTDPVLPTAGGNITITGAQVAAGSIPTNVIETHSTAANQFSIDIQRSSTAAASNINLNGVSHFASTQFAIDANGFVTLLGGGEAIDAMQVQANTAPGVNPVEPSLAGIITVNGNLVVAHSVPIETRSRALNTWNIEPQISAAVAATDITKNGMSHYDSTQFTVDANGFVTLTGAGVTTIKSVVIQTFTTTGTYTPTAGMVYCVAECQGAGGGGGGVSVTGAGETSTGGGGGGGGYSRAVYSAATIGASKAVTIGAGGTAGAVGGGNGGNGGTTSLDVLFNASGGGGGNGSASGAFSFQNGGGGGVGVGGNFITTGTVGGLGWGLGSINIANCGQGGSSYFGSGGTGSTHTLGTAGQNGFIYGGGGAGGANAANQAAGLAGGVGAQGIVVITEYVS